MLGVYKSRDLVGTKFFLWFFSIIILARIFRILYTNNSKRLHLD